MKNKKLILALFGLFTILGFVSFVQIQGSSAAGLTLKIDSPKNIYKLGEPINFSFELDNNTREPITLLNEFSTGSGFLHVKVSSNGGSFVGSDDPGWGIDDNENKTYLKPNGSVKAEGDILWNYSSQETPKFKFENPGVYYFKASYTANVEGSNNPITLESEPIQITIEEPVGDDLKAWNRIRANGEFAYFIQKANILIPSYKPEEKAKFLQEIDQLLNDYPNSFYSDSLKQSLSRFRATEANLQESMRKLKNQE